MAAADSFIPLGFNLSPFKQMEHKALNALSDLGDLTFYINRRIACVSAGYPATEALHPTIQDYITKLELSRDSWKAAAERAKAAWDASHMQAMENGGNALQAKKELEEAKRTIEAQRHEINALLNVNTDLSKALQKKRYQVQVLSGQLVDAKQAVDNSVYRIADKDKQITDLQRQHAVDVQTIAHLKMANEQLARSEDKAQQCLSQIYDKIDNHFLREEHESI